MAILSDHLGDYIGEGIHIVKVKAISHVTATTKGTRGIEFELEDAAGKTCKTTFWLTDKALWRLATFAQACGVTDAEMKGYDTDNPQSHNVLFAKKVAISYLKPRGERYSEVHDYWGTGDDDRTARELVAFETRKANEARTPSVPVSVMQPPIEDDIPF